MTGVRHLRHARYRKIGIFSILMLALWQLGEGGYIYLKAQLAQVLLKNAWSETRAGNTQVKPWPWADTWPVARLQMPQHNVDLFVLAGDNGRTLAFGPGHRFGTAAIGEPGLSMISGHRDTHFAFLKHVRTGDELRIARADGTSKAFRVSGIEVVDTRQTLRFAPTDAAQIILVTCYPFDTLTPMTPYRYLVLAESIS